MSQGNMGHEAASGKRLPDVYVKLLDTLDRLDLYTHRALKLYPKYERFLLCAEIRNSMMTIERLIVTAWLRYHKQTTFRDLDVEKEVLKRWVIKSLRLGYITAGKSIEWIEIIDTLGRQIGGWIKHEKNRV